MLQGRVAAALGVFGVAVALFCAPVTARAQQAAPAPSQVQPPAIAPVVSAPARIILPRVEAGAAVPAGAQKLAFSLTDFTIEGEFAELAAERHALEAPLVGKRVSVAQVFEFAAALQGLYVRAGYPLVRIVVTPQELAQKASVKLLVVDGFIERIDASSIPELARRPVLAMVSSLLGKHHLTQAELERQLLIAGETPGLILNAVFSGGKEVGGSILVLTGTYRAVSMSVYADNAMPQAFGGEQVVTTASLNSVFGWGEQLTVSAAGLPDENFTTSDPTRRYLSGTFAVPLGIDGWHFEGGFTDGTTTPRLLPTLATLGLFTQGYAQVAYEAIKRRDFELTFTTRFDTTDQQIDTLVYGPPIPVDRDRLRVLRGSVDGLWQLRPLGTALAYGATLSQGLDVLGARMVSDASEFLPLSRAGANAIFTKLGAHFGLTQSLPNEFAMTFSAAGQTSFNHPLLTPEQFDISGAQMLSGYTTGLLVGDTAWVVRDELGRGFALPYAPATLAPYVFAASGERILAKPSAFETRDVYASNVGAGVRVNVSGAGVVPVDASSFVEVSRQYSPEAGADGWRIFVGGILRY